MKTFLIIDGNAFMHRAYHALPKTFKNSSGQLINAVYGFGAFLIHALKTENPDFIAITFDSHAPTFRHQDYVDYKATRVKAPDDFYSQIPLIKKLIASFDIPTLEAPGYESDDLIASLVHKIAKETNSVIYTGDHDILQLVESQVTVAMPLSGIKKVTYYDIAKIYEKYGLTPIQIVDYKALRGDPSDNIPGVKGIGEVTAKKLLQKYHSLSAIYDHLSEIDPKTRQKLQENRANAFLSHKLATLIKDIPIAQKMPDFATNRIKWDYAMQHLKNLHFLSLLPRAQELAKNSIKVDEKSISSAELQMEIF